MRQRSRFNAISLTCLGMLWLGPMLPAAAESALPGSDEFSSADAAAKHCPGDTVVWSTLSKSKVFHTSGSKYYGKTKHGAYVCEKEAVSAGYHASKR